MRGAEESSDCCATFCRLAKEMMTGDGPTGESVVWSPSVGATAVATGGHLV